jgi:uncharacterized membrane protein
VLPQAIIYSNQNLLALSLFKFFISVTGSYFASSLKTNLMNVKRTFGIILTVLGIAGLIYFATLFMNAKGTERQIKTLVVYGVLGAIFFFTGISLIRTTKDDARPPVR